MLDKYAGFSLMLKNLQGVVYHDRTWEVQWNNTFACDKKAQYSLCLVEKAQEKLLPVAER